MSDSVRPHRWQPTRLPCPWDSPSKNTGAGCHFLLQCMKVKSESEVAQLCLTLRDPMECSLPDSSVHGFSRQEYWSGVPSPSPSLSLAPSNSTVLQGYSWLPPASGNRPWQLLLTCFSPFSEVWLHVMKANSKENLIFELLLVCWSWCFTVSHQKLGTYRTLTLIHW